MNIYTNTSNYTTAKSSSCSPSVQTEYFSILKHYEKKEATLKTDTIEIHASHTIFPYGEQGSQNRSMHRTFSA